MIMNLTVFGICVSSSEYEVSLVCCSSGVGGLTPNWLATVSKISHKRGSLATAGMEANWRKHQRDSAPAFNAMLPAVAILRNAIHILARLVENLVLSFPLFCHFHLQILEASWLFI
jgi:hypothetical protein